MNKRSTFVISLPEIFAGKSVLATKREIRSSLRADQPQLVMDLSRVREMDCTGLDLLLQCMVEVSRKNGSLTLADVSPQAATYLELARMDRAFGMFPSVAEAIHTGRYSSLPNEVAPTVVPVPEPAAA